MTSEQKERIIDKLKFVCKSHIEVTIVMLFPCFKVITKDVQVYNSKDL